MPRICQNGVCQYIQDQLISISRKGDGIVVTVETSWFPDPMLRPETFTFPAGASINVGDGTNPSPKDISPEELASLFGTPQLKKGDRVSANLLVRGDGQPATDPFGNEIVTIFRSNPAILPLP
jgi:hypothetical protein